MGKVCKFPGKSSTVEDVLESVAQSGPMRVVAFIGISEDGEIYVTYSGETSSVEIAGLGQVLALEAIS